jgi:hypothetical protein
MHKKEIIDAILEEHPSASREFLNDFSTRDLTDYLKQLRTILAREESEAQSSPNPAQHNAA